MNVAAIRKSTGLSQRGFAEALEIPVRTLQQWEQGRSAPPEYVVNLIRKAAKKLSHSQSSREAGRHSIAPKSQWRVCIPEPFQNCEKVYPIQQRKVQMLLNELSTQEAVQEVWVFGPSVTERCHMGSDVDMYIETSGEPVQLTNSYDFAYDLWSNQTVDERLLKEIKSKGVKVYG